MQVYIPEGDGGLLKLQRVFSQFEQNYSKICKMRQKSSLLGLVKLFDMKNKV